MIATIAEQFTGDPSDRERSPTIIRKPGLSISRDLEGKKSDLRTTERAKIKYDVSG